jgi:hypothetical protein
MEQSSVGDPVGVTVAAHAKRIRSTRVTRMVDSFAPSARTAETLT